MAHDDSHTTVTVSEPDRFDGTTDGDERVTLEQAGRYANVAVNGDVRVSIGPDDDEIVVYSSDGDVAGKFSLSD